MRKILSLVLGLLWALPAFADLDPCRNLLNTPERLEISKWYKSTGTIVSTDPDTRTFAMFTIQIIKSDINAPAPSGCGRNFYGPVNNFKCTFTTPENTTYCRFYNNGERINSGTSIFPCEPNTQYTFSMDVISANPTIRNGIIYSHMQLEKGATATEFTPACTGINVATTKYTNKQFEPLDLMLSNAISVVDSVVSQTISQAGDIAKLQTQKQTRPADDPSDANNTENCPAGKKCLLVEDASGVPHWYEIVEKYSRLPDGYTELEYIESTGTQYVDTGIYGTEHHGVEIQYKYASIGNNSSGRLFGGRTSTGSVNAFAYLGTGIGTLETTNNYFYISTNNGTPYSDSKPLDTDIHTVSVNANNEQQTYFDGIKINTYGKTTPYTHSFTTCIFRAYNANSYAEPAKARVYYCKIYDNKSLVRDFIPARRNSDNVLGMYDLVTGQFFTNAGTGEFIGGQPVFN